MEKIGLQRSEIESQLADTELYTDAHKDMLKKLLTDQAYLQKELDQAEADWLQATEAHEALSESLKASA